MKAKALTVFAIFLVILQLTFPTYFLADAVKRESEVLEKGEEYIINFNEIYIYYKERYYFGYQNCYEIKNYYGDSDELYLSELYLYDYYDLAVKKDEKGNTEFYIAETLSNEELEAVDRFPNNIYIDTRDFEFTGSIKNDEELYNLLFSDEEDFIPYKEFSDGFFTNEIKGRLKIKLYGGILKVTEVIIDDEVILKLEK
ncbi:MAG: hypothetical protein ACI4GC_06285 [Acutalibacteraceae bacterium]